MFTSDGDFLIHERQAGLLREAHNERLARLAPRGHRAGARVRTASLMIALAVRIAPSLRHAPNNP